MGIRIDALNGAASATSGHELPAMAGGATVKLTVAQISTKVQADSAAALNAKAPLASPALTGNPTAPTPTTGDNDTSIATTAFVQTAVAAITSLTGKATPVDTDEFRIADSAASFGSKKLSFANLKAWVRSWLPLSTSYTSADQTVTAGGLLTLSHGLGKKPELITLKLKCTTAEQSYLVGDEIELGSGYNISGANSRGASAYTSTADATTTLYVRYGSDANTFNVYNKTTGTIANITNSSWRLIVKAFA